MPPCGGLAQRRPQSVQVDSVTVDTTADGRGSVSSLGSAIHGALRIEIDLRPVVGLVAGVPTTLKRLRVDIANP